MPTHDCCNCGTLGNNCQRCKCVSNKTSCLNCSVPSCRNKYNYSHSDLDDNNSEWNLVSKITDVKGDGHCLFRCISKELHGNEDKHLSIRNEVIDTVKKNPSFYKKVFDECKYGTIENYLHKLKYKDGETPEWGDQTAMLAISEKYNIDIYAYSDAGKDPAWYPYTVWECNHDRSFLTLINHNQTHFQLARTSVRPCPCRKQGSGYENILNIYYKESIRNNGIVHQLKTIRENNHYDQEGKDEAPANESLQYEPCNENSIYHSMELPESNNQTLQEQDYDVQSENSNNITAPKISHPEQLWEKERVENIYSKIIHLKHGNMFVPTSGNSLQAMIKEMTYLINEYNNNSPSASIALKLLMIMPKLLLLRPHKKSKTKENNEALKRRIKAWQNKELDELLKEAEAIQKRTTKQRVHKKSVDKARQFRMKMEEGFVRQASQLLQEDTQQGILKMDVKTIQSLKSKHPSAAVADESVLIKNENEAVHEVIYEPLNAHLVRKAAMETKGSAGPSGMDAKTWRRILTSNRHAKEANALCIAIANLTKRMCTSKCVDTEAITACRLIAARKNNGGVRPIGIGEVLRRIMGKCVMKITKSDVMEAAGNLQLCAGQQAGAEAAIHATREIFQDPECQALIMVDAENAFNTLNREAMIHNISRLCPSISKFVENTYNTPPRLVLTETQEIESSEGTTQGDPIAMAIYALGLSVLQKQVHHEKTKIKQVAFADDMTGAGELEKLKIWWDLINEHGPKIGYYPNAKKSCLIVKPQFVDDARRIFANTQVKISTSGEKHLGAAIGSEEFRETYSKKLVEGWIKEVNELSEIAKSEPHAAFTNFNYSMKLKWNYAMRTIPGMSKHLKNLEDAIRSKFIPSLFNCQVSDELRKILSLPPRLGGMGIIDPSDIA